MINPIHFQELSAKDPHEVCRRALCRYDPSERMYSLTVWGDDVKIFPRRLKIESTSNKIPDVFHLFAIHYLIGVKDIEIADAWISEKEVPGGATFFRGPHRIPTDIVSARFANDIGGFRKRCEQLGGGSIRMADAAYTFQIVPRIPVAVLYWCGDDDFPAECKILYDRSITGHLAPDIIYALAVGICRRLGSLNDGTGP